MLAKTLTCAVVGLEGALVEVEVDIGPGLPAFNIVGLPDAAVQEAKERVRAAVKNSGSVFPQRRITVNLAPAALQKEGPCLPTVAPAERCGVGSEPPKWPHGRQVLAPYRGQAEGICETRGQGWRLTDRGAAAALFAQTGQRGAKLSTTGRLRSGWPMPQVVDQTCLGKPGRSASMILGETGSLVRTVGPPAEISGAIQAMPSWKP